MRGNCRALRSLSSQCLSLYGPTHLSDVTPLQWRCCRCARAGLTPAVWANSQKLICDKTKKLLVHTDSQPYSLPKCICENAFFFTPLNNGITSKVKLLYHWGLFFFSVVMVMSHQWMQMMSRVLAWSRVAGTSVGGVTRSKGGCYG